MDCKKRLTKVLAWAGAVIVTALAYAALVRALGFGIPCPFHALTGLLCPGCGVTRMGTWLLRGDMVGAFSANPVLFCALPAIVVLLGVHLARYVKTGEGKAPKWEERCWLTLAAVLLAWGVVRNLPALRA